MKITNNLKLIIATLAVILTNMLVSPAVMAHEATTTRSGCHKDNYNQTGLGEYHIHPPEGGEAIASSSCEDYIPYGIRKFVKDNMFYLIIAFLGIYFLIYFFKKEKTVVNETREIPFNDIKENPLLEKPTVDKQVNLKPAPRGIQKIIKMQTITKDTILQACGQQERRICFSAFPQQLPKKETGRYYGHINLPFGDGIIRHIFPDTLWIDKKRGAPYVWLSIKNKKQFDTITDWCNDRGNYVYLRDCLSASAALGVNFNHSNESTEVRDSVYKCKFKFDELAISYLMELALEFINKHDIYKNCDCVVAVPPNASKGYDLPSTLAYNISQRLSVPDITKKFDFGAVKSSARNIEGNDPKWFDKKWNIWQSANLTYNGETLAGKKILLIDDNYQSGLSLQYVAMILQNAGADQVYGLTMIKTRGDKGN